MDDEMRAVPTVGGENAGYLFEFTKDGVFLTVYPVAEEGILFELSDMRQILKEYDVSDYDIELLARTVREASGRPQKLSEHFQVPANWQAQQETAVNVAVDAEEAVLEYGKVILDISKDRMKVTVRFECKDTETQPTEELVMQTLQEKNIVYGIDLEAIHNGLQTGSEFIAAQGQPPVNGEDAQIVRKFNLGEKGRPVANKYDQVDYKNLNLFVIAKKGDLLAERVPQTRGVPGTNVFGDEVPAKNGKPKPLPNGKNTVVKGDNAVVADIDGQIVDTGSKISIDPHLDIRGDVGLSTGNIDFVGGITISGSVQAGFVVKATGDVEIKGMVSGATIAARNVFISGGVQGMNRGQIQAKEDVKASFAENAEIEAGGDITITDVSLHSTLRAGRKLIVEGKRGQITGGTVAAGEEIRAVCVGNPMNVVTKLAVGVNPMLQKRYQEVCKEYTEAKKRLMQLTKALNTLGKIDINQLPPERVDQINALTRSQFPLAGTVERDEKLLQQITEEMQKMKNGKIRVRDVLYPGSKLSINSIMKNVQSEEKHCTLYVDEDFVKTGPY